MDKTIRKYTDLEEMKADEYREWQALPDYERLNAAFELSLALYQLKEPRRDVQPRLQLVLSIFNYRRVKYRVVGAYAVGLHAQPRATKDLDVLIKPDAENGKAV